jgi:hypothetical protein
VLCQMARLAGARADATPVAEVPGSGRQGYAWPSRISPLQLPGAPPAERHRLRQQEAWLPVLWQSPCSTAAPTSHVRPPANAGAFCHTSPRSPGRLRRWTTGSCRRVGAAPSWDLETVLWSNRRDDHFCPETVFHALEGRARRLTGPFPALSRNQRQPRTPVSAGISCPWRAGALSEARQDRWTKACTMGTRQDEPARPHGVLHA